MLQRPEQVCAYCSKEGHDETNCDMKELPPPADIEALDEQQLRVVDRLIAHVCGASP